MASTTIKLSVETRDRLQRAGWRNVRRHVIEALDILEAQRFWQQAEAAATWRRSLPPRTRSDRAAEEAAVDGAFDGLD